MDRPEVASFQSSGAVAQFHQLPREHGRQAAAEHAADILEAGVPGKGLLYAHALLGHRGLALGLA